MPAVSRTVTNRLRPTGGVTIPISMLTTMMMPKWMGSMPRLARDREGDWHEDQDDCRRLHEVAGDQQDQVDDDEELPRARRPARDDGPPRCSAGCSSVVSTCAKRKALAMMKSSITVTLALSTSTCGMSTNFRPIRDRRTAPTRRRDGGDRRRLGRGEDAAIDAAQDDHEQQQAPDRLRPDRQHLAPGGRAAGAADSERGRDVDRDHEREAQHRGRAPIRR